MTNIHAVWSVELSIHRVDQRNAWRSGWGTVVPEYNGRESPTLVVCWPHISASSARNGRSWSKWPPKYLPDLDTVVFLLFGCTQGLTCWDGKYVGSCFYSNVKTKEFYTFSVITLNNWHFLKNWITWLWLWHHFIVSFTICEGLIAEH